MLFSHSITILSFIRTSPKHTKNTLLHFGRHRDSVRHSWVLLCSLQRRLLWFWTFLVFLTSAEWSLGGNLCSSCRKIPHQLPVGYKVLKYRLMSYVSFCPCHNTLTKLNDFLWTLLGTLTSGRLLCHIATAEQALKFVPSYLYSSKLVWKYRVCTCLGGWNTQTRQALLSFQSTNPTDC